MIADLVAEMKKLSESRAGSSGKDAGTSSTWNVVLAVIGAAALVAGSIFAGLALHH